jgi:hypothetical protein
MKEGLKSKDKPPPPGQSRDVPLHALYAHTNKTAIEASQQRLALTGWL